MDATTEPDVRTALDYAIGGVALLATVLGMVKIAQLIREEKMHNEKQEQDVVKQEPTQTDQDEVHAFTTDRPVREQGEEPHEPEQQPLVSGEENDTDGDAD